MSSTSSPNFVKVALCQFSATEDKEENFSTAKEYISKAAASGAQLVVLPEIWNSPYATSAFADYAETNLAACTSPSAALLQEQAKKYGVWLVGGSIPERADDDKIYNTCLVFNPKGELVCTHRKVHLFDIDVPGGITFKESDTLCPGQSVSHFSSPWGNIGVGICYDIRFPELALLLSQKYGCRILVYPGAFNMTTGPAHWELLQRARALDNQCYVLTASPARHVHTEEEAKMTKYPPYTAWGHSTVVSPWGEVVATTDEQAGIVVADLDMGRVDEVRQSVPILAQKRNDIYNLEQLV